MKQLLLLFAALLLASSSAKVSYDGFQVWSVTVEDELGAESMRNVIEDFNLDVLGSTKTSVDFLVNPKIMRQLRTVLARYRLQKEIVTPDLGKLIRAEEERIAAKPAAFTLDDYNTFEDIEGYLAEVAETSEYATLNSIGNSVEGRSLWQLKISVGGEGKPSVWFDCNIHAREWITGATCLYGIDLMIGSYGTDPDVTTLLDTYDVYFLPINNPDGYAYTWSDDRMWRKNRNKYIVDTCYGIDLNRNFDDHFGGEGTSSSSCSETYHGPSAASEPETQAVQDAINDLIENANLKILYSIHSYSQLWMYPYGYTADEVPPEADQLDDLAKIGCDALTAVHGKEYEYGPVATTIYPAASTTIDYSYAQGVVYSYTLELRDKGLYGFQLPADQITPTAEETWAGLLASILAIP